MKFCDKLSKLRKENNLSQEDLAEKLSMSRQAISKWESGNCYPDMATMIRICKILNCTLEDIMDDGAIGNSIEKNNKFNINKWINDLLSFITKTYNMFCSMKFREKVKCIFEMSFLIILLIIGFNIVGAVLRDVVLRIFNILPDVAYIFLLNFCKTIFWSLAIALGFIITIHIFKIRYLDYFVTIEDNDATIKSEEKVIEENKPKYINEIKKEKIIIRDPKHSTYSFFSAIGKIILFIIKIFVIMFAIPTIISFICLCFCGTVSFWWLKYGMIFVGIFIAIIGMILVNYDVIELMYTFIFNRNIHFKRIFIFLIVGISLFGIGFGISFTKYVSFNNMKYSYKYDKTNTMKIEMNNNLVFEELNDFDKNLIKIDDSKKDIEINYSYINGANVSIRNYHDNYYSIDCQTNGIGFINMVLNDIKNNTIRYYDFEPYKINKITLSQINYNRILNNNKTYYD